MENKQEMINGRAFLKSGDWERWNHTQTDQRKKVPVPAQQKPIPEGATLVSLPDPATLSVGSMPLITAFRQRRSVRGYSSASLSLEELSFLLWATQGISGDSSLRRTSPSGGARHPFETYLYIRAVESLELGLYRYLPLSHQLVAMPSVEEFEFKLAQAACHQPFVSAGAVTFLWTVIPYRSEWRYDFLSHKVVAIDAGHLCQNLYLAGTAIGCGTCAIGAYSQEEMDALLGVDGTNEFIVYLAVCGKERIQGS